MTPEQVLATAGQPDRRAGSAFTYCVDGGRADVEFDRHGRVGSVVRHQ